MSAVQVVEYYSTFTQKKSGIISYRTMQMKPIFLQLLIITQKPGEPFKMIVYETIEKFYNTHYESLAPTQLHFGGRVQQLCLIIL